MPQAIGAALARPGTQVIALCDDGELLMLLEELSTIVQWACSIGNGSCRLADWQTDMPNSDFEAVAESMGMKGFSAYSPGEVSTVIERALAADGPALINILTDPNALAMPPKTSFNQMKGFATAMTKIMFNGQADNGYHKIKLQASY